MSAAIAALLLAAAYLLLWFGVIRAVRWHLREQDRLSMARFRAVQLVAEARASTLTRDQQFREACIRG